VPASSSSIFSSKARPPYRVNKSLSRFLSRLVGLRCFSIGPRLRFSQCAMRSVKRLHAQPTPPSSMPKRSIGKRLTTPPKMSAREGVAGGGEVTDVVEAEVVDRLAPVPAHAAGVCSDRDLEVHAGLPEGVVVVRALVAERVDVVPHRGRIRHLARQRRDRPLHV